MSNKNLLIFDSISKKKNIDTSEKAQEFIQLYLSDIVKESSILNDVEFEELYFYFDESMQNKESINEIARLLGVRQYYVVDANNIEPIDSIIENAQIVSYGDIKADSLRKNVDILYQNKISQMLRWMLFKHRSADASSIRKIVLKRATPVVLGIIAQAEQKIIDFTKEEYKRVSVEYVYRDEDESDDLDRQSKQPKLHSFKIHSNIKFRKEHEEELKLTMDTLRNENFAHVVKDIKRNTEERAPFSPLTTTRLQRSCFYLFDIDPVKTLSVCEDLCNGIIIDGTLTKLITSPFTQGFNISEDVILDINKALLKRFGIDYVLPSKRTFTHKDEDQNLSKEEAIRPLNFTNMYSPERLQSKLPILHYEIYKFIHDRTLATQMKNSIYDASKLIVEVNDIELIANAHKLEFDGWERLDGYRQRVSEIDDKTEEKEVVLPKSLYVGKVLKSPVVTDYPSTDKNPPRYGKGRLLTTLVDKNLCKPEHAYLIIEHMEKAGLIIERQHMMHPQEIGMITYSFFEEYAPDLLEEDLLREYEQDLLKITNEEGNPDEVYHNYEAIVRDLELKIGYEENNNEPEEWMIEKAKKVAKFHGDILSDDNPIFYSKQSLFSYINAKENDLEKIGKCPECKSEQVVEDTLVFKCIDRNCKFKLYKDGNNGINGFFTRFKKEIPHHSYKDVVSILLKSKAKIYFNDLVKASGETFAAYVVLSKNKEYNNWQLQLSFPKSKKAVISESLKAENLLGSFKSRETEIEKSKKKEEKLLKDANAIKLSSSEDLTLHCAQFNKMNVSTTIFNIIDTTKQEEKLQSILKKVDKNLDQEKRRYKLYYAGMNEFNILLVGEYLIMDLFDLNLDFLMMDESIKVEIKT